VLCMFQVLGQIGFMPVLVLAANICPPGYVCMCVCM
jgi:hypothetical protein